MPQLNVKALNAEMMARQARRHQCFDKVLESCFLYIKKHANCNITFCFYEVPEFILGFPCYNLNDCISYLIEKLQKNDFLVKYYFPCVLYISWNVNEIKEEKLKQNMSMIKALEPTTGTSTSIMLASTPRARKANGRGRGTTGGGGRGAGAKSVTVTEQQHMQQPTLQMNPQVATDIPTAGTKSTFASSVKQFTRNGKLVMDIL